jgi:hypothetical protein
MTSYNPVIKNGVGGAIFYVTLYPRTPTGEAQANPTLATGDVKIAVDDGAPANLATLPVVDADFTKRVKVVLSQAETNGDNLTVIFSDAAGAEWNDLSVNIQTAANQFDDLATIITNTSNIESDTQDIQSRLPSALVSGRIDASVGAMANDVMTAAASADFGAEIADAFLDRDMSSGTDSGSTTVRTARQALRFSRNRWVISGGNLTVYKEDDATSSWSSSVSSSAGNPLVESDPAGP